MSTSAQDAHAQIHSEIEQLKQMPLPQLRALADAARLPTPASLRPYTFWRYREERTDGSIVVIVQGSRSFFIFGKVFAEGFVVRPDGTIEAAPETEVDFYRTYH